MSRTLPKLENLHTEEYNLNRYDIIRWDSYNPNYSYLMISVDDAKKIISVHTALMKYIQQNDDFPPPEYIHQKIDEGGVSDLILLFDDMCDAYYHDDEGSGAFIKMHRSPKDADWSDVYDPLHFVCRNGMDVLLLLVKSERICEDLYDYIARQFPIYVYFQKFIIPPPKRNNEFRVFVYNKIIRAISQLPYYGYTDFDINDVIRMSIDAASNNIEKGYDTFAADIEVTSNNSFRIFEINPFDSTTDLYMFSTEEMYNLDEGTPSSDGICRKVVCKYNCTPTDDVYEEER